MKETAKQRNTKSYRASPVHMRRHSDCCPSCKTKFKAKKFNILWNDFVECTSCGNMWIAYDIDELRMYS